MVAVCVGGDSPDEKPKSRGAEREPLGSFFGDHPLIRLHEDHECSVYVARDTESNLVSAVRVTRYPGGIETPCLLVDAAEPHEQEIVTDSLSLLGVRSIDDLFNHLSSHGLVRSWQETDERFGHKMIRCVRALDMRSFVSLLQTQSEFRLERFDGLTQASFVFRGLEQGTVEVSVRVRGEDSPVLERECHRLFDPQYEQSGLQSFCLRVFREEITETNMALVQSEFEK